MKRLIMISGLAVAMAAPSMASARDACQQYAHDRKVTGTLLGAVGGALVGHAVSHKNGALIGGVGGAVVGNQLARHKCDRGYRAYNRTHYTTRHRARHATQTAYRPARYADDRSYGQCRYENRAFYDENARLVYRPIRVCN